MLTLDQTAMYRLMSSLGFYDLSGSTTVRGEFQSYLVPINFLLDKLENVRINSFVQTCLPPRLRQWERILGIPYRPQTGEEARRATVLARLALSPLNFDPKGAMKCLEAAGIQGSIQEYFNDQKLLITVTRFTGDYDSIYDVMDTAKKLLPAHLTVEFEFGGPDWTQWEANTPSWEVFDSQDRSWQERDTDPQPATE